jgi:predicted transcriptional regulator
VNPIDTTSPAVNLEPPALPGELQNKLDQFASRADRRKQTEEAAKRAAADLRREMAHQVEIKPWPGQRGR